MKDKQVSGVTKIVLFTFIEKSSVSARFMVFRGMVMKFQVAWYVTLCRLVNS
jgi:hypothetical protein